MRYNTLEAAIIRSGRGAPDSRPTPHVSVHLSQTVDPEQPESLTWWQRRWSVVESLPHVAIYLTNTAHTPWATVLQQPWFVAASCQRGEGGTTPTDFSFFSGVKFKSFILCECLDWTFCYTEQLCVTQKLVAGKRKETMRDLKNSDILVCTLEVHSVGRQIACQAVFIEAAMAPLIQFFIHLPLALM